jgi:hypothetical protein
MDRYEDETHAELLKAYIYNDDIDALLELKYRGAGSTPEKLRDGFRRLDK